MSGVTLEGFCPGAFCLGGLWGALSGGYVQGFFGGILS